MPTDKPFFPDTKIFQDDHHLVVRENNEYKLQWNNTIKNRFFLALEIYDTNNKFIFIPLSSYELNLTHDIKFFHQFHNKCLSINKETMNDAIDLFNNIEDLRLSKLIQLILIGNIDKRIKFFIIEPNMYHKIEISSLIQQPEYTTQYIGAGDTIFSSHFAVGAGLNRLLHFINYVIWYIESLSED